MITVTLPAPMALLGVVLGGILIGFLVYGALGTLGFLFADAYDFGERLIVAAAPVGVLATIGGWAWLWGMA